MPKNTIRSLIIIIFLIAIGGTLTAMMFRKTPHLPNAVTIETSNQPTTGNPHAHAHMVVFEDLKCMNCMRFNTTLLPQIKQKYIDTGKAKYTFINVAFIPGSKPAANAARCVYQQNKKLFFIYLRLLLSKNLL